jgi:hypothetical protein
MGFRICRRVRIFPGLIVDSTAKTLRGRLRKMNDTDNEQPECQPIPRAWQEEFDGIKPIRPVAYRKPPKEPLALKEARRLGVK